MRALASLAMQGRSQAVMLVAGVAILSLLFPPLSIISSAVIGLVALRKGAVDGMLIMVLALIASGVLSQLALGGIGPIIGFGLLLWLPVLLVAWVLRATRSLPLAVQCGLALGVLVLIGQYLQVQDPVAEWEGLLKPFSQHLVEAQILQPGQQQQLVNAMAKWMPGVMAAAFFLQSIGSLLLARWWQALLYNPGGFAAEFQQLRLPKVLALVTLVGLAITLVSGVSEQLLLLYLVLILLMGWFLQGLSLVHAVVAKLKANGGWILGVYLLLVFAMPHTVMLLACLGLADTWFDFRARVKNRSGSDNAS